jgi:hypothetical protein
MSSVRVKRRRATTSKKPDRSIWERLSPDERAQLVDVVAHLLADVAVARYDRARSELSAASERDGAAEADEAES